MECPTPVLSPSIPKRVRGLTQVSILAASAGVLFGFDTAVINGALVFITQRFHLETRQIEMVATILLWGCLAGSVFGGVLSDRFGRKRLLLGSGFLFFASSIGTAVPNSLTQFLVARFVGGVAIGIASTVAPLYLAELAPAHRRGSLVSLNQLAIVTGILLAYLSNWGLSTFGAVSWRLMFASGAIPAGLFCVGLLGIPESPRWLLQRGRRDEASSIYRGIGGVDINELELAIQTENAGTQRGFALLTRPILLAVALAILQQTTGINAVLYYGSLFFEQHAGRTAGSSIGANVLIGVVNLLFTLLAFAIIDRIRRKVLLGASAAVMVLALGCLAAAFRHDSAPFSLIMSCTLVFVAAFAVGFGPGVWLYISELFPTAYRGRAMSIATAALWGACILVTNTFLSVVKMFGVSGAFLIYASSCLVAVCFVFFLPETMGRSLEDIHRGNIIGRPC